jgi:hypothetical protein
MRFTASKSLNNIMRALNPRQQEVVSARFGLAKSEKETLAKIGKRFGITRERVRQIESAALTSLGRAVQEHKEWGVFLAKSKNILEDAGGVMRCDQFLTKFAADMVSDIADNHIALITEATPAFSTYPEDRNFHPFYYLGKEHLKTATAFLDGWAKLLETKRAEALRGKYDEVWKGFLTARNIQKVHADNYIDISKKVHQSPYGDVGLASWPEIRPRTIRDKVYLVLKKGGKPFHFREIAERIGAVGFDSHGALATTVHNELIKDPRFVLVGRGIYGLRENGYEPGTAREVIERILKESGALNPQEVVLAVQKNHFFKPNTVLVNLQNKNYFKRLADGRYQANFVGPRPTES